MKLFLPKTKAFAKFTPLMLLKKGIDKASKPAAEFPVVW